MDLATRFLRPVTLSAPVQVTSTYKLKSTIPSKPASVVPPRWCCRRRNLLLSTGLLLSAAPAKGAEEEVAAEEKVEEESSAVDTTITDRVFMDITMCPTSFKPERSAAVAAEVSSSSASASASSAALFCAEGEPLGRIVIGLYGKQVPRTVANFKAMCTGAAGSKYEGSLVHKIFPGQYFLAGKQGRRDKGEVPVPTNLERNAETVEAGAFKLRHIKPGTVSLCLSENDDDDQYKLSPDYRNVEFLVTTGPGPCPQLDYKNIVFGTVLEGMDVVTAIAAVPTYKPGERIRQLNDLAEFLGDERAQNARNIWNRPLKNLFISSCGELRVAKPSLAPSLP